MADTSVWPVHFGRNKRVEERRQYNAWEHLAGVKSDDARILLFHSQGQQENMDFLESNPQMKDAAGMIPDEEQSLPQTHPLSWCSAELGILPTWEDSHYYSLPDYRWADSMVSSMPGLTGWATTAISTPTLLGSDDIATTPLLTDSERLPDTPTNDPHGFLNPFFAATSLWQEESDFTSPLEGSGPFRKSLRSDSNMQGKDTKSIQCNLESTPGTGNSVTLECSTFELPEDLPTSGPALEIPFKRRRQLRAPYSFSKPTAERSPSGTQGPTTNHDEHHKKPSANVTKQNLQHEKQTPNYQTQGTASTTKVRKKSMIEKKKHSVIEKKYRISIKERFERLLDVLPAPEKDLKSDGSCTIFRGQLRRSKVLDLARGHIQSLGETTNKLQEEIMKLNEKIEEYKSSGWLLGVSDDGGHVDTVGLEQEKAMPEGL